MIECAGFVRLLFAMCGLCCIERHRRNCLGKWWRLEKFDGHVVDRLASCDKAGYENFHSAGSVICSVSTVVSRDPANE
jgi:hypothetical protein